MNCYFFFIGVGTPLMPIWAKHIYEAADIARASCGLHAGYFPPFQLI